MPARSVKNPFKQSGQQHSQTRCEFLSVPLPLTGYNSQSHFLSQNRRLHFNKSRCYLILENNSFHVFRYFRKNGAGVVIFLVTLAAAIV